MIILAAAAADVGALMLGGGWTRTIRENSRALERALVPRRHARPAAHPMQRAGTHLVAAMMLKTTAASMDA